MSQRINQVQPRTKPLIYFCQVTAVQVLAKVHQMVKKKYKERKKERKDNLGKL